MNRPGGNLPSWGKWTILYGKWTLLGEMNSPGGYEPRLGGNDPFWGHEVTVLRKFFPQEIVSIRDVKWYNITEFEQRKNVLQTSRGYLQQFIYEKCGKSPKSELKTLEWWIQRTMLDLLFFIIARLNIACSPHGINLRINYQIRIRDIPF